MKPIHWWGLLALGAGVYLWYRKRAAPQSIPQGAGFAPLVQDAYAEQRAASQSLDQILQGQGNTSGFV